MLWRMRRSVSNPRNPFHEAHVEWLEEAPEVELDITEVHARSILSKNTSPDIPFNYSLNPYQGCYHGCAYCYARPSHQRLGHGAGTDFERKLFVKTNAVELLRETFARRSWTGESIVLSGNTDCYQPLEAKYQLTRGCLEACLESRNPVAIITKGVVIQRDVELLGQIAAHASASVFVTVPFLDEEVRRVLEPFAAPIERRFEVMRRLYDAGVNVGISVAPVIPGLNDSDVPMLLERARACGASRAFMSLLRLPAEVKDVFFERVEAGLHPKRVEKITHAMREMRGGQLNDPRFGMRMQGQGKRWQLLEQMFELHCRRLGLNEERVAERQVPATFSRPKRQLTMFD
jgi:DNA repair photolyase